LQRIVILHGGLIVHGGQECMVSADVVDSAGIPDLAYLVGDEQVRQQFDVIAVWMTEDEVVDGRQRRSDGLDVRRACDCPTRAQDRRSIRRRKPT
jgi:hypothetical protein